MRITIHWWRWRDWVLAAVVSFLVWVLAWTALSVARAGATTLILPPLAGGAFLVVVAMFRKLHDQARWNYRQMEACVSLARLLRHAHPLPPMRDFAISPDFALLIASLIEECKPDVVLELGSGVSTVVVADLLLQAGRGSLISLEHDPAYAARCRNLLRARALTDVGRVELACLVEVHVGDDKWRWYDLSTLAAVTNVDLLIIDGPPATQQPLARFPALPILMPRLREHAVIVLDDADRVGERAVVKRWQDMYTPLDVEHVPTEKGAVIIRRSDTR